MYLIDVWRIICNKNKSAHNIDINVIGTPTFFIIELQVLLSMISVS